MKKIFTTVVAFFAITQFSYAQWTAPSGGNITTSYNVGIGTALTDLYDYGNFSGSSHSNKFITFGSNTFVGFEHTTNNAAINFAVTNAVSSPDIVSKIVSIATSTGNNAESGDLAFYTKPPSVSTAALERMRILSSGFVGIGTSSPSTSLHLKGSLPFETIQGTAVGEFGLVVSDGTVSGAAKFSYNSSTGENRIGGIQSYAFPTFYSGGSERMRILSSGYVGIGTTTPQEALSVNGNIRSKQVKVEAANWPDYVFKPNYILPSLLDVKTYINKYQHLPDMPSEAEVAKDGLNLGEINKLLTKKVEELTLYLIEQNKQITELKHQVEAITKSLTKN